MNQHRGILIAGNWKMNHTSAETEVFFSSFKGLCEPAQSELAALQSGELRACIFPPMLSLAKAQELSRSLSFPLSIGAQNVHWEKKGAFTGEVSAPMVQELGIQWALVGHSERRQYFGETNESVRKRTQSLLDQGFHVITCLGETLQERQSNQTKKILTQQFEQGLADPPSTDSHPLMNQRLVLAYEPVWAIGTGVTASVEQIEEAHALIRSLIADRWSTAVAQKALILYGGSVSVELSDSILGCPHVDGALVGGASLKSESFFKLLQSGARTLSGRKTS